MNVVGEIGNFIMTYQEPIQGIAIFALLIGGMICIGKAVANERKKRSLLEQIQESVSEINTNVRSLGEQKTEVFYIDGITDPEDRAPETEAETKKAEKEMPVMRTTERASTNQETELSPETEAKPAVKYFSRDCAVAKDGRQYTFEELNAQIRD